MKPFNEPLFNSSEIGCGINSLIKLIGTPSIVPLTSLAFSSMAIKLNAISHKYNLPFSVNPDLGRMGITLQKIIDELSCSQIISIADFEKKYEVEINYFQQHKSLKMD